MTDRVRKYIRQYQLLQEGDRVTVGLSGGADSVCLLLCMKAVQEEYRLQLQAVHVHHGLRGEEADRDAAFAESLCRKLAVPFRLRHAPVRELARREGLSLEEAGRILRYQILREESNGGKIAVAHHRDDQSETLLFHMVRGTGIRGLAGMLPEKDGIIRPLLCVGRAEIEVYLQSVGQEYCVDSTNADTAYARNRIRCELLPWLRDNMNPRVSEHLAELAEQAAQLDAWLQEKTVQWLDRYGERTPRGIRIPLKEWKELPAPLMAPVLLEALEQCGGRRDIGSVHIRQIEALMEAGVGSRASLPGGREAEREYTAVFLGSGREKAVHELPEWHMTVYPVQKDQKIEEKQYTKCFDYDKIKDTVLLRYRQTGDYLELAGTGKKTVKRYMIDRKIPAAVRDSVPVFADGSHVLWIVGYRISEEYKVTEQTRRVLQITVGGKEDE